MCGYPYLGKVNKIKGITNDKSFHKATPMRNKVGINYSLAVKIQISSIHLSRKFWLLRKATKADAMIISLNTVVKINLDDTTKIKYGHYNNNITERLNVQKEYVQQGQRT